jgi:DNA-directed RNA polymerase subunit RPC12/RpoP
MIGRKVENTFNTQISPDEMDVVCKFTDLDFCSIIPISRVTDTRIYDVIANKNYTFSKASYACVSGDHKVVWSRDIEGNTIVRCEYCNRILYDGKEPNVEALRRETVEFSASMTS